MSGITQSLAGRSAFIELLPFSLPKLSRTGKLTPNADVMLLTGCYPPLYDREVVPTAWFASYMTAYVERDVRQQLKIQQEVRQTGYILPVSLKKRLYLGILTFCSRKTKAEFRQLTHFLLFGGASVEFSAPSTRRDGIFIRHCNGTVIKVGSEGKGKVLKRLLSFFLPTGR